MIRFVLFLICALFVWTAWAEPPVSLSSAIELALENDIRLLSGRADLSIAQLRQESAAVWRDPELRLEPSVDADEDYIDSAIRFYLPHPWRVHADGLERASQTAASTAQMQMGRIQVATEIFQLYREFQCLEKELALVTRLIEIKQQRADVICQQVDAAMKTSTDALLFRWELRDAQREARTLRCDMDRIQGQLAERIARPVESLRLEPLPEVEPAVLIDSETVDQLALELRPDLQLLHAQLQQAQSRVQQADAERIPWFSYVQAGYADSAEEWRIQAAVSLPIFSLSGSKKRQALAEQALRRVSVDASQDAIALQVRQAAFNLNNAIEEWQMHRQEMDALAAEAQQEIEMLQEYAAGAPDEWMKLQERIVQADRRLLDVRRDVNAARADYLLGTGQILIQD
ncbi:MAG: TolC family protein [Kiritimatiellales bacterium]|nr:TolC family protein [Kiritimatiellota bacterium]MBL7011377.1 TolC family protein [Kiritimatiellales bacterium]